MLILAQTWRGYGLETAVKQKSDGEIREANRRGGFRRLRSKRVTVNMGEEMGRYHCKGTTLLNGHRRNVAFGPVDEFVRAYRNKALTRGTALQY
jgi:hypothetical protein